MLRAESCNRTCRSNLIVPQRFREDQAVAIRTTVAGRPVATLATVLDLPEFATLGTARRTEEAERQVLSHEGAGAARIRHRLTDAEVEMYARYLALMGLLAGTIVIVAAAPGSSPRTPWGEADRRGVWTGQFETPLQRRDKYAGRELLTGEEVAALDKQRAAIPQRPRVRPGKGSEADVAGAYNGVFVSVRPTSRRTSLIVDPADGRIPPVTPEVQKRRTEIRDYQLALLQSTQQCKNKERSCAGWTYGPPSPKRDEQPPLYMTANINRANGP